MSILFASGDDYMVIAQGDAAMLRAKVNELKSKELSHPEPITDEAWEKLWDDMEEDFTSSEMYSFRIHHFNAIYVDSPCKLELADSEGDDVKTLEVIWQ